MAKTDTAQIGVGNVEITLNGETRVLKTSYRAAQGLSRQYGGFSDLVNRLVKVDLDAIESVIVFGLGLTEKGQEGLGENIYKAGAAKFVSPCLKYVTNLANGGQPPVSSEAESPNGEGS